MITKFEIYGIVMLVACLAAAAFGFYERHQGVMEERTRWEAKAAAATKQDLVDLQAAVTSSSAIAQQTLDAVGKIKVVNKTITNEVQHEIQTNVRYAADCLPSSGLQLWNAANRGVLPAGGAQLKPPGGRPELPAPR